MGAALGGRLHFLAGDAQVLLSQLARDDLPDVIYLDPMFPPRRKSALVKKEMQLLQRLLPAEPAPEPLLKMSLRLARKKVVVKRPKTAPPLCADPSLMLAGKNTRFDIYHPTASGAD